MPFYLRFMTCSLFVGHFHNVFDTFQFRGVILLCVFWNIRVEQFHLTTSFRCNDSKSTGILSRKHWQLPQLCRLWPGSLSYLCWNPNMLEAFLEKQTQKYSPLESQNFGHFCDDVWSRHGSSRERLQTTNQAPATSLAIDPRAVWGGGGGSTCARTGEIRSRHMCAQINMYAFCLISYLSHFWCCERLLPPLNYSEYHEATELNFGSMSTLAPRDRNISNQSSGLVLPFMHGNPHWSTGITQSTGDVLALRRDRGPPGTVFWCNEQCTPPPRQSHQMWCLMRCARCTIRAIEQSARYSHTWPLSNQSPPPSLHFPMGNAKCRT